MHPQTSVELLQTNNLVLNNATEEGTCNQLQSTVIDWVKSNAFETRIDGTKSLHLLSLVVQPMRCPFQYVAQAENTGLLVAMACQKVNSIDSCPKLFPFLGKNECRNLCLGWSQATPDERLDLLENFFGIRPSTTLTVNTSTSSEYHSYSTGQTIPADFSVSVLWNEELSVRRT